MANTVTKPDRLQTPPFILIGIWLATGYWVIEAYLDTLFIENVSFAMRLFPSDQNELWMRSLISVFFIGLGLYLHKIHARIRAAEKINVDAAWLLKNAISKTIRGNFPICVSCKKKVGKIDKYGMAQKPVDWLSYVRCLLIWCAFCLYIWWAFLRDK